jgi:hypothetical protein
LQPLLLLARFPVVDVIVDLSLWPPRSTAPRIGVPRLVAQQSQRACVIRMGGLFAAQRSISLRRLLAMLTRREARIRKGFLLDTHG